LPFKLVASGIHVMSSVVQLTLSLAGMMGDKVLPASVMRAARGAADATKLLQLQPSILAGSLMDGMQYACSRQALCSFNSCWLAAAAHTRF
jgi:hypothetical protein